MADEKLKEDIAGEKYDQLKVLASRAVKEARHGNIPELEPILSKMEAAYKEIRQVDPGLEAFHAASREFGDGLNAIRVLAYADNTDTLRSLGFLTAAEKALELEDKDTARKAYEEIKPGTELRRHLDAQRLPNNNLKARVEALEKRLS